MITISVPWGEADPEDPDLPVLMFAWRHYQAGHRYVVRGEKGARTVECECREETP